MNPPCGMVWTNCGRRMFPITKAVTIKYVFRLCVAQRMAFECCCVHMIIISEVYILYTIRFTNSSIRG